MALSYYDRLKNAISKYKDRVDGAIKDLRPTLITDIIVVIALPIALSIVAYVWSNVVGLLTTLGLGGINAADRFHRGHTMLKSYWSECSKLRKTVSTLEIELILCDPSDEACLQKVEALLRQYLDALG